MQAHLWTKRGLKIPPFQWLFSDFFVPFHPSQYNAYIYENWNSVQMLKKCANNQTPTETTMSHLISVPMPLSSKTLKVTESLRKEAQEAILRY